MAKNNEEMKKVIQAAEQYARTRRHEYLQVEHLLWALLKEKTILTGEPMTTK